MKNKIIGITIFLFGFMIMGGVAYFFLQEKINLSDLLSFFNKTATVEAPSLESVEEISDKKSVVPTAPLVPADLVDISNINKIINVPKPSIKPSRGVSKEELLRLAGSFAERFGSYSNQSNFSNIEDLKIFMSARMKTWADDFISDQKMQDTKNNIYYGITTKTIAKEMTNYDDDVGYASVLVHTRRREATNSTNNTSKVFGQTIVIKLIKEHEAWKVDSANWLD